MSYLKNLAEQSLVYEKKFYKKIGITDDRPFMQMSVDEFYKHFKSKFNDFQSELKSIVYGEELLFVDDLSKPGFYVNFRDLSRISVEKKSENNNNEEQVSEDLASKRIKSRLNEVEWAKYDQDVFKGIGQMIFDEAKILCQEKIDVLLPILGQYAVAALRSHSREKTSAFNGNVLRMINNNAAKGHMTRLKDNGSINFSQQDLKAIIKKVKQDERIKKENIDFDLLSAKKDNNILGIQLMEIKYGTRFENEEKAKYDFTQRERAIAKAFYDSIFNSLTKKTQPSFRTWWGRNIKYLVTDYKEQFFQLIDLIGSTGKSVKLDKGQIGEAFFAMLFQCTKKKTQKDYLATVQGGERDEFGQLPVDVVLLGQFGFQIKNYTSLPTNYNYFRLYETSWKLIPADMNKNPLAKYLGDGLNDKLDELRRSYKEVFNPFNNSDQGQLLLDMDATLHDNIPAFMRFANAGVVDKFLELDIEKLFKKGDKKAFANVMVNHFYIVKFDIFPASILFMELENALTETLQNNNAIRPGGYFGLTTQQYKDGKAKMVDIPPQDSNRNLLTEWIGKTSEGRFYKRKKDGGAGFPPEEIFFKDARLFFSGIEFTNFREIADAQVKQTR